jgi:predicted P-loop ATPase
MLERAHEDWDGNKHIENLLPRFVGADKTAYNTAVLKLFMLGAIKRIYQPGCKFDYMLILVGAQGTYKSSFLRFLAVNDVWFSDNFNTVDGDKAFEKLRGMWIVEMSELQATKRAKDVETIKAFITSRKDVFRAAYDRRTEQHDRQCVIAGTSNPVDFLTDRTGNRRFLPVTCSKHKISSPFDNEAETKYEFMQAWGEAMDEYLRKGGNVRLVLPEKYAQQALEAQTAYMEEDPDIGIIQEWLDKCGEGRVCVKMIWDIALNMNYSQMSRMETNRIHDIMKNQITGWKYVGKQSCGRYGVQRCYDRISLPIVADEKEDWQSLNP